jgi:hypothetical protein
MPRLEILLNPNGFNDGALGKAYARAFKEAVEVYVATAYLTHWNPRPRLNPRCELLVFIVGTDFGRTRKKALEEVHSWLPKKGLVRFAATEGLEGSFHPKIILWKAHSGRRFAIIGSSNLSKAAFESNHEANVVVGLDEIEYQRVAKWLEGIAEAATSVDEEWISSYRESKVAPRPRPPKSSPDIEMPKGKPYRSVIQERRAAIRRFNAVRGTVLRKFRESAQGTISNREFWRLALDWKQADWYFQGLGFERHGKRVNWKRTCRSLIEIIDAVVPTSDRDAMVARAIDGLASAGNPSRKSWFTEMLSHFWPDHYPVWNGPIDTWLRHHKWRAQRGSSEGNRYIQIAQRLRDEVRKHPSGAQSVAELDAAIWKWVALNLAA